MRIGDKMNHWGKHLIIDAASADFQKINDKEYVRSFVVHLLNKIQMVPLAPLWLEYCETNDPKKAGISYVQVLQDSHSAAHFCALSGDFYFDCFSCKDFDVQVVQALLIDYFNPKSLHVTVVIRDSLQRSEATTYTIGARGSSE